MELQCPYCKFGMNLKEPKPGKFKPSCRKCNRQFLLVIPAQAGAAPQITTLSSAPATVPNKQASSPAAEQVTQPPDSIPASADALSEQTLPSAPATPLRKSATPVGSDAQATSPSSEKRSAADSDFEATMDSVPVAPVKDKRPAAARDHETRVDVEATMDAVRVPQDPKDASAFSLVAPAKKGESQIESTMIGGMTRGNVDQTNPSSPQQSAPRQMAAGGSVPARLGGYNIIKELGRGAMGAVYLAKQNSLNRLVALKTVQGKWLDNPVVMARFTREAFAAAQLIHHNVVQVYDLGSDHGTTYFSMEYVRGESLADMVKRTGKLEPEQAATYILQAARGLRFAHNQGMVHRDVKPGNLMINDESIVKVADLGLVKVSDAEDLVGDTGSGEQDLAAELAGSSELTVANFALGTASYMAPEQAANSKGVDHRADIYSLGCSLYVLLTGKPPHKGKTALEVISKHKTEQIVRPELIVKEVPEKLSSIVMKMVARELPDRYASMGEVIDALESYLGLQKSKTFSPGEDQANAMLATATLFRQSKTAKVRSVALLLVASLLLISALGLSLFRLDLALAMLAALPVSLLSYFVVNGIREQSILFNKTRQFVLASRLTDWITWAGAALLALVALLFISGPVFAIVAIVLGIGLGAGLHFIFDSRVTSERAAALTTAQGLLRKFRLQGIEESTLHKFVASYSGSHWEEFFEQLFGYEAKLQARALLQKDGATHGLRKFRPWRDALIARMETRLERIQLQRQSKHLQKIEQAGLQAQGINPDDARKQAEALAQSIIKDAEMQRDAMIKQASRQVAQADPQAAAIAKRERIKAMLAEARGGKSGHTPSIWEKLNGPLSMFAGPHVRFLLGCLLLIGCLFWLRNNGWLSSAKLQEAKSAFQPGGAESSGQLLGQLQPLGIPLVGVFVSQFSAGIAGLILAMSTLFRGWKMSFFLLPAAAVMVLGPVFLKSFGPPLMITAGCLATGLLLSLAGYFLGQTHDFD